MNCTIVYCINFLSNEAAIDNLRRLKSICDILRNGIIYRKILLLL